MSELPLKLGDTVYYSENNNVNCPIDGVAINSHWGLGKIVGVLPKGTYRFQVCWRSRGCTYWMRNRDLLTKQELNTASTPCEICGRMTRIEICPKCRRRK
jgi:hypothetical protein